MVMKAPVWDAALTDIAQGKATTKPLTSAVPHRAVVRHDDLTGRDAPEVTVRAAAVSRASSAPNKTDDNAHPADDGQQAPTCAGPRHTAEDTRPILIVPTPAGTPFTQRQAEELSKEDHLVFACGRYEGIDSRALTLAHENYRVREISIGDYVLVGGEVAVLAMVEAIVRLIPGVLGNRQSHEDDSFTTGLLEGGSYTKPQSYRGQEIPAILRSGNHAKIARWRRDQALAITARRRPDLIAAARKSGDISSADEKIIAAQQRCLTQLSVLVERSTVGSLQPRIEGQLDRHGIDLLKLEITPEGSTCQPDNVLLSSYQAEHDQPPTSMEVVSIIAETYGDTAPNDLTQLFVDTVTGTQDPYPADTTAAGPESDTGDNSGESREGGDEAADTPAYWYGTTVAQ